MDINDTIEVRELDDKDKVNDLLNSKSEFWMLLSVAHGTAPTGEAYFRYCLGRTNDETNDLPLLT